MTGVRNPRLYATLRRVFGGVRVSNAGSEEEQYRICCPFCGDRRYRLYIRWSYQLDVQRQVYDTRRRNCRTVWCHNETLCMSDPEKRDRLRDLILEQMPSIPVSGPVRWEPDELGPEVRAELPGCCIAVSRLPEDHAAVKFLRGRGLNPDAMARQYGLRYCRELGPYYGRLIIPVRERGILVGFQARSLNGAEPKYLSSDNLPRGRVLYNLDRARRKAAVVVVESPSDVWHLGDCAVAAFGAYIAAGQVAKLAELSGRTVFLVPDGDVWKQVALRRHLTDVATVLRKRLGGQVAMVQLPESSDPADLSRERFWKLAHDQARQQGVTVEISNVQA